MKQQTLKKSVFFSFLIAFVFAAGCANAPAPDTVSDQNRVVAGDPMVHKTIGDQKYQFEVMGKGFLEKTSEGTLRSRRRSPRTEDVTSQSLVFSLPMSLLGQPMIFGGEVIKVTDKVSEDLGRLKLSSIPPLQVLPVLGKTLTRKPILNLMNCNESCSANPSSLKPLLTIPVAAVDNDRKVVVLDLSELGKILDFAALHEKDPALTSYQSVKSQAVAVDYSQSTLLIDVEAHLVPKTSGVLNTNTSELVITNRWFLKLEDIFNPSFKVREPLKEVGFFTTDRNKTPLVQRFDLDARKKDEGVKYYIKNVPLEYQPSFAGSFDEWNEKLLPIVGKKVFNYEFIPPNDPRNQLLVAGDIRYNILEWDLVNKAPYGGFGPSVANQYTGETFSANVLVQGPTIIELYKHWFKATEDARHLREDGRGDEAVSLITNVKNKIRSRIASLKARKFFLRLNKDLEFVIRSDQPSLEDPLFQRDDFEEPPAGMSFEVYMAGYFHDMVTHELGHNLGLRHNFRGNLGAADGLEFGKVSRSIMEYLGKGFRHLDRVGEYDLMAISFGYTGKQPEHSDWFCTDEDVSGLTDPAKSAECTRDDATNDPFGFFEAKLARAVDLIVARDKSTAPEWKVDDLKHEMSVSLLGMGTYAESAEKTGDSWTNFFNKGDRPKSVSDVKAYTLSKVKARLCDPSLIQVIAQKETADSRLKTQQNLDAFRAEANTLLNGVFYAGALDCGF